MNNCLYCQKAVSAKAKYCSEAHRKAYVRRTKKGEQPGQNDPDIATRTLDFSPTRTDRLFEDSKPNYYKFDDKLYERKCFTCGVGFKSHLKLLKFCSPAHQLKALDTIVGKMVGK